MDLDERQDLPPLLSGRFTMNRVFIIEDCPTTRATIRAIAEDMNLEVQEANDGSDAIKSLEEGSESINLILLDWEMLPMDGIATLRYLRKSPRFSDIPVVMVTVANDEDRVSEAAKEGATDYLLKPFSPQGLKEKIWNNLSKCPEVFPSTAAILRPNGEVKACEDG